jgi:uncharacterized membrane protein
VHAAAIPNTKRKEGERVLMDGWANVKLVQAIERKEGSQASINNILHMCACVSLIGAFVSLIGAFVSLIGVLAKCLGDAWLYMHFLFILSTLLISIDDC